MKVYETPCTLFSFTCIIYIIVNEKVQKLKKWYSNELPYNIMLFTSLLVIAYDNDKPELECFFFLILNDSIKKKVLSYEK